MSIESAQAMLTGLILGDLLGNATQSLKLHQIYQKYGEYGIEKVPIAAILSEQWHLATARFSQFVTSDNCHIEQADTQNLLFCAMLAYIFQDEDAKLLQRFREAYANTDENLADMTSGLASVYLVKLALDDVNPNDYFAKLWDYCSGISATFDMTLRKIGHVLGWGSEIHAMRHLGKGEAAEEILTIALYCVLRYPDDYHAAVRRAANTNGKSHIIAGITGAIMGARLGLEAMPESWQEPLQNRKYILELARKLFECRGKYVE